MAVLVRLRCASYIDYAAVSCSTSCEHHCFVLEIGYATPASTHRTRYLSMLIDAGKSDGVCGVNLSRPTEDWWLTLFHPMTRCHACIYLHLHTEVCTHN